MSKFKKVQIYVGLVDDNGNTYDQVFDDMLDLALAEANIDGATVYDAQGVWQGARENSKVIEILIDELIYNPCNTGFEVASFLKRALNQQSVLLTTSNVVGTFI